jgi:hypothetical protein
MPQLPNLCEILFADREKLFETPIRRIKALSKVEFDKEELFIDVLSKLASKQDRVPWILEKAEKENREVNWVSYVSIIVKCYLTGYAYKQIKENYKLKTINVYL